MSYPAKNLIKLFFFSIALIVSSCRSIKEPVQDNQVTERFMIIIDAGSTSSKLNIYKVIEQLGNEIPIIDLIPKDTINSFKTSSSISEFLNDSIKAAQEIKLLMKTAEKKIDPKDWNQTQLYILATAGLRLKSKEERKKIFQRTKKTIEDRKTFKVDMARTISGRYEGLYGWLTVNYDNLSKSKEAPKGILEMGGASTQIAYTPSTEFVDFKLQRKINGKLYGIYSRSFLGFGDKEIERLANSSNCYLANSPVKNKSGKGNYDKCSKHLVKALKDKCTKLKKKCFQGNNDNCSLPYCIFGGNGIPKNDGELLAVPSLYFVLKFLEFDKNINLNLLKTQATKLCSTKYDQLKDKFPNSMVLDKHTPDYCWKSAFYYLLLNDAYKLPIDSNVTINIDYEGWTKGAVMDIEMGYLPEKYIGN